MGGLGYLGGVSDKMKRSHDSESAVEADLGEVTLEEKDRDLTPVRGRDVVTYVRVRQGRGKAWDSRDCYPEYRRRYCKVTRRQGGTSSLTRSCSEKY